jgi:ADP-ribose pyrophosphatase YjhB (NUDIX family)
MSSACNDKNAGTAMISLRHDGWQFDLRAAAIAIHHDHVLLHRAETDDFWAMPGGRVELGEKAEDAVVREMREETAMTVTVERLVWVVENFFALAGRRHHELGFYYLVALPPDIAKLNLSEQFFGYEEGGPRLIFQWFPINTLSEIRLYPSFLQTGLGSIPGSISHIVQNDPDIQNG